MKVLALIPARMGSSRFPGKPLMPICGEPMIQHVYSRTAQSSVLSKTVVATCDQEIYDFVLSIGGSAVMTASSHDRASDRCAEALAKIEAETSEVFDIVVMVQGDEPLIEPEMIDQAVIPMLRDDSINVINLMAPILSDEEFNDRNCIKVVCDLNMNALYFSREPIPTPSKAGEVSKHKQVCVIPFRREYLLRYIQLEPTPLEVAESVDMMRVLEHGDAVRMVPTDYQTFAVDTPQDLSKVEQIIKAKIT